MTEFFPPTLYRDVDLLMPLNSGFNAELLKNIFSTLENSMKQMEKSINDRLDKSEILIENRLKGIEQKQDKANESISDLHNRSLIINERQERQIKDSSSYQAKADMSDARIAKLEDNQQRLEGAIGMLKWLISFVGFSGIAGFIYFFATSGHH